MDRTNDTGRRSADGSEPYEDDSRLRQPEFTGIDDPILDQAVPDDEPNDRPGPPHDLGERTDEPGE